MGRLDLMLRSPRPRSAATSLTTPRRTDYPWDPKIGFDGMQELSAFAALGSVEQLKRLLHSGCDPNIRDSDADRTPLHWAAIRGHTKCVEKLLAWGAERSITDAHGRTALALVQSVGQPSAALRTTAFLLMTQAELPKHSAQRRSSRVAPLNEVAEDDQVLPFHAAQAGLDLNKPPSTDDASSSTRSDALSISSLEEMEA